MSVKDFDPVSAGKRNGFRGKEGDIDVGALLKLLKKKVDFLLLPLQFHLDFPVREISHPAGKPQRLAEIMRPLAEADALNRAGEDEMFSDDVRHKRSPLFHYFSFGEKRIAPFCLVSSPVRYISDTTRISWR